MGALRFFLLRFTRNTVIAFDYQDALAFDGETGPYVQYAAVRAANIFRKAGVTRRGCAGGGRGSGCERDARTAKRGRAFGRSG